MKKLVSFLKYRFCKKGKMLIFAALWEIPA